MVLQGAGDSEQVAQLGKELAAATTHADALKAELSGLRQHSAALEAQLRSARAGASLQDIRAVAGRDKKLVGTLSPLIPATLLLQLHLRISQHCISLSASYLSFHCCLVNICQLSCSMESAAEPIADECT